MQAYQPVACPHCGATWNRPDAAFCQDCQQPLISKPHSKGSGRAMLVAFGAFLVVAAIGALVVVPMLASNVLASDKQALAATLARQPNFDAAIAAFLTPVNKQTGHGGISEADLQLSKYQSVRDAVRADRKRVEDADHQLEWMAIFAFSQRSEIVQVRNRNRAALEAMRQADGALTTAVDQATLIHTLKGVKPGFDQMLTAAEAKDYAAAEKLYPDLDRKLLQAESLVVYPDFPNGARSLVRFTRGFLDDTEKIIVAARNHDAYAGHAAYVALEADQKTSQQYTADFFAKWDAWNATSLQPGMTAYHESLRQIAD